MVTGFDGVRQSVPIRERVRAAIVNYAAGALATPTNEAMVPARWRSLSPSFRLKPAYAQ